MRRSLPRLQADSGFRALVHELQEEGWLDWHVLTGACGIVLNVRLAAKGLNTREVVPIPAGAPRPGASRSNPRGCLRRSC